MSLGLGGCGGENRGEVAGQVTLDGQPVDGGEIRFLPNVGLPSRARIANGQYTIPKATGPSVGPVRVEITWVRKTGRKVTDMIPGPMIDETTQCIPERYNRNSELEVEIQPGTNRHDFELKSK
ncbi:MAG: hypothetical protein JXM70_31020 [Pirellulales bacterium]|nr:hypothetical protein [Pirellulales bacterium]